MTDPSGGQLSRQDPPTTPNVVRDEAAEVGRTAAHSGEQTMQTVGEQTRRVAEEATRQARNLVHDGREQLLGQARDGQQKAAQGLHTVADQLERMSANSDDSGLGPQLVGQAAEHTRTVASWLDDRDPGDLVDEVRDFARRKPGMFLAGAALAGLLVGRLTRGVIANQKDDDSGDSGDSAQPARPTTAVPPAMPETYAPVPQPAQPGYPVEPEGYPAPPAPWHSQPPPSPPPGAGYPQQPAPAPPAAAPPGAVPPPWHGPGAVQP